MVVVIREIVGGVRGCLKRVNRRTRAGYISHMAKVLDPVYKLRVDQNKNIAFAKYRWKTSVVEKQYFIQPRDNQF